jgi:hypothetical protein
MVRNWAAAAHVLAKLCLSVEKCSYRFSGGLEVKLESILTELGWSVVMYTKKSTWFRWAAEAAALFWPTLSVPGKSHIQYTEFWL